MSAQDLDSPLGMGRKPKPRRMLLRFAPHATAAALALALALFVGWTAFVSDPYGGEPMVMVAAGGPMARDAAAAAPPPKTTMPTPESPPAAPANGRVVTIIDGSTGQRQEVPIAGASATTLPARADQRLTEASRHGPIPRIAPDGARPSDVYAKPLKTPPPRGAPRVAIIIGGLGIGTSATDSAFAKLPGPVTFAVSPYAGDAERTVARARAAGHEVLLQVPMEPFDYPDNDPGPQTLLTALSPEQNVDRLHWLMSRYQGYVGLVNMMGARFTSSEPSLSPVLREAARRGLLYIDDVASPRSVASQIAGANNLPFARADVALDAVPNAAAIDKALARVETLARERGLAVASTSALPAAIDRIGVWIKAAEARGIVLVPISAAAARAKAN